MPTIVGSNNTPANIHEVECPKCNSIVSYYDTEVRRINVTSSYVVNSDKFGAIVKRAEGPVILTSKNSISCPKCSTNIFVA